MLRRHCFVLVACVCAAAAKAQVSAPSCTAPSAMYATTGAAQFLPEGSGPLEVQAKYSYEQRLADGTHLHSETVTYSVRDMHGRTMNQRPKACYRDKDGNLKLDYDVTVNDLQNGYYAAWTVAEQFRSPSATQIVTVIHSEPLLKIAAGKPENAEEVRERRRKSALENARKMSGTSSTFEDLGTKTIAGTEAYGWRTTHVIPTGVEGNDAPMTYTDERWRSLEFGIPLAAIHEDPRHGKTSYEVTMLTRTEPEEAWFAIPTDRKLIEQDLRHGVGNH